MKPRTTAVGQKEQNGTVEAQNGAFKRYLNQRLQARGSREFTTAEAFDEWLVEGLSKENSRQQARLQDELAVMKPVAVTRMPEYREQVVRVSRNSTINIMQNIYSVPPRLMHQVVRVRLYEDTLEVYYPSLTFRTVYERLQQTWPGTKGDAAYLRILHLAASTLESEVQVALELLLESRTLPTVEAVRDLVGPLPPESPVLPAPNVDLGSYDQLLEEVAR